MNAQNAPPEGNDYYSRIEEAVRKDDAKELMDIIESDWRFHELFLERNFMEYDEDSADPYNLFEWLYRQYPRPEKCIQRIIAFLISLAENPYEYMDEDEALYDDLHDLYKDAIAGGESKDWVNDPIYYKELILDNAIHWYLTTQDNSNWEMSEKNRAKRTILNVLEKDPDVDIQTFLNTILQYAVEFNKLEIVRQFGEQLSEGRISDMDTDTFFKTVLQYAVEINKPDIIRYLWEQLSEGRIINMDTDIFFKTVLQYAVEFNTPEIIVQFWEQIFGGRVTNMDIVLDTDELMTKGIFIPLHDILTRLGRLETINRPDGDTGRTLLHHAVMFNKPAVVRQLLELGADPKVPSDRGDNILELLAQKKVVKNGANNFANYNDATTEIRGLLTEALAKKGGRRRKTRRIRRTRKMKKQTRSRR